MANRMHLAAQMRRNHAMHERTGGVSTLLIRHLPVPRDGQRYRPDIYRCELGRVESTNAAPTRRVTDSESMSAQTTWIVYRWRKESNLSESSDHCSQHALGS